MRLLIDENVAAAERAFAAFGEVATLPGRAITRADVADARALIVRSVTSVGPKLLDGTDVRFVGTATSGYDHIDRSWLDAKGIGFAHAPGCNAVAVTDWVVAALAALHAQGRHRFGRGSVGVIGAGQVGARVARRLAALGYDVAVCDPPRAAAEGRAGFVDLEQALERDVVTLHVPLASEGPYPTRDLIGAQALARIPSGAVLLNAARGGVVDEDALATRLDDGPELVAAIDTWAGEPAIDVDLLPRVALATPHVAGNSREGRLRGTALIAAAAGRFFRVHSDWDWRGELPPAPAASTVPDPVDAVLGAYDPRADDARLRGLLKTSPGERGRAFDRIRRECPQRREFGFHTLDEDATGLRATGLGQMDPADGTT